jgi:hypothetical protein
MNREMQSINRQPGFAADLLSPIRVTWAWFGFIGVVAMLEYGIWREEWYGWMPLVCTALLCAFCPPRVEGNGLRITKLALCLVVMGLLVSLPPLQPYIYAFKVFCLVACAVIIPIWGLPMRRLAKQLNRA